MARLWLRRSLLRRPLTLLLAVPLLLLLAPAAAASAPRLSSGAVFAITNAPDGNAVVAYARSARGGLTPAGTYATGGNGTGAGLGSQDAVIVSDDHRLLFAVNAGSDSVSSFRIRPHGLELVDEVGSGGTQPVSVAYADGLLYVLNAGTPNSVAGIRVAADGTLSPLPGSTRALSADSTSPAQVGFDATGTTLVVTERATNRIDTFSVRDDGRLEGPVVTTSAGPTPFGFALTRRGTLLVSEAGAGGGASSYRVGADAGLTPVSSNVMTGQRAACWAVATANGRFGYVTNAGTGTVTGFALSADGSATLLDADGVTAVTGGNPTDAALSAGSRYLYVRVAATGSIAAFAIAADGALRPLPSLTGTPTGLAGLAAF